MKKHDEGYVLAYVTVVLLLFCLVASMILTGALKNLQHQQDTITRMQDQYVAAGMIEQVVAQWETAIFEVDKTVGETEVLCTAMTTESVTLSATYGTVTITCEINKTDKTYEFYDVGSAPTDPSANEGGASE